MLFITQRYHVRHSKGSSLRIRLIRIVATYLVPQLKIAMRELYVCLTILLCFACKNINCLDICDQGSPDVADQVYLKLYSGNSSSFANIATLSSNPDVIASDINTDRETVVYVHGFVEDADFDNVLVVIKAYLDRGDVNVILVDWGSITLNINYLNVSSQVAAVGKAVAEALTKLSSVIDLNRLSVVGHSLGAHVAGQIGRHMNTTLNRITGLDPAFPLFYPSECHLKPTDAKIVTILHTNGGGFGTPFNTGTVDFYANTGIGIQPGCSFVILIEGAMCSHKRSTKLFAESVKNPNAFPSRKCFENPFKKGDEGDEKVYFGDSTPENIRGEYCFFTNSKPPYSKAS